MKKFLFTAFLFSSFLITWSQNLILLKDSTVYHSNNLSYFDNHIGFVPIQDTSTYRLIPKDSVFLIQDKRNRILFFENYKDIIGDKTPSNLNIDLYEMGREHATIFYKNYDEPSQISFFMTLLSPALGLIPSIAMSSTTPEEENLDYPNEILWQSEAYAEGYRRSARKIKSRNVWDKFGLAFGINVLVVAFIYVGVIGEVR